MLVDDSEDHLFLTKSKLEAEDSNISVLVSNSAEVALDSVKKTDVDCIVSDYEMAPGMNGMEFYKELRREGVNKPFIFLTGQGNEELAREAFLNGVDDYFTKDVGFAYFTKLINAVKNSVRKYNTLKTLQYTQTFNKNIVSHIFEGFSVQDTDNRILLWSEQLEKISGIEEKDVIGKAVWDIFRSDVDNLEKLIENALGGEQMQQLFLSVHDIPGIKNLKNLPARIVPFRDDNNQVLGSIIILLDPDQIPRKS